MMNISERARRTLRLSSATLSSIFAAVAIAAPITEQILIQGGIPIWPESIILLRPALLAGSIFFFGFAFYLSARSRFRQQLFLLGVSGLTLSLSLGSPWFSRLILTEHHSNVPVCLARLEMAMTNQYTKILELELSTFDCPRCAEGALTPILAGVSGFQCLKVKSRKEAIVYYDQGKATSEALLSSLRGKGLKVEILNR